MRNVTFLFLLSFTQVFSQGFWFQKAYVGTTARNFPVGFSIGNYGYIGTGNDPNNSLNDFWKYDPSNNTWTQIANFQGSSRQDAAAFVVNGLGYVGAGANAQASTFYSDFWKYDPVGNTWTQVAAFPGASRISSIAFSVGAYGYVGLGTDLNNCHADIWRYDPAGNSWTSFSTFQGSGRTGALCFTVGTRAYMGAGSNSSGTTFRDLWRFDPAFNSWLQCANIPDSVRHGGFGFSIGSRGYAGGGHHNSNLFNDFFEYDPTANTWATKPDYPGGATFSGGYGGVGFSINGKGYLGILCDFVVGTTSDFWEYDPNSNAINDQSGILPSVSVFPNPAIDKLTFSFDSPKEFEVCFYDLSGQKIFSENMQFTKEIDVSNWAKGTYFYSISDNSGNHLTVGKVVHQ